MGWCIEVLTRTYHIHRGDEERWLPMRSTGGSPYDWATEREARAMMDLCYPEARHRERVRVTFYEAR